MTPVPSPPPPLDPPLKLFVSALLVRFLRCIISVMCIKKRNKLISLNTYFVGQNMLKVLRFFLV